MRRLFSVAAVWAVLASVAWAQTYVDAVLALEPSHYFRLNELTDGEVADIGTTPTSDAVFEGDFVDGPDVDPPVTVGEDLGQVGYSLDPQGADDPFVNKDGEAFAGLEADNRGLFNNNALAVNLGPGRDFADPTMTVAMFFRAPCKPDEPGVECQGAPASSGGERIFSNNFPGQNTGGSSDVDDLGHLQVDFGSGANLVVSIDNNFSDPLKSNFQVAHGDLVVKDNNWHHLVVSRNGDDLNDVILVVDGEHITSDRWVDSTDSWGVTEPFDARIGTRTTAPHPHTFNGWTDEVSIWLGKQLTVEESISLYNAALGNVGPSCDTNTQGDFDGNGRVEFADFLILSSNFGSQVADHTLGDADCDGSVAFADFLVLSANFGQAVGAADGTAAVPEPSGMVLSTGALLCLGMLRRRR